jgi:hypothetical protein
VFLFCAQPATAEANRSPSIAGQTVRPEIVERAETPSAGLLLADGSETDSTKPAKVSTNEVEQRRTRYLTQHATLTKDAYDQLFSGACDQRNTRDCFILAALGSIPMSHREALFRTSITRDEDGFLVKFPMGVSNARDSVRVYNRDLEPQIVFTNGKPTTYQPVNTTAGWKALEAAYILLAFGRDQRGQANREAAAYGDPVTVLERIVNTKPSAKIIVAAGKNSIAINPRNVSRTTNALNSFDPDRHMLTLGSLNSPSREFFIDGIKFTKLHAYVVPAVDRQKQTVMLINPHDSRRPLVVTYGMVVKAFRVLRRLEFDVKSTYK